MGLLHCGHVSRNTSGHCNFCTREMIMPESSTVNWSFAKRYSMPVFKASWKLRVFTTQFLPTQRVYFIQFPLEFLHCISLMRTLVLNKEKTPRFFHLCGFCKNTSQLILLFYCTHCLLRWICFVSWRKTSFLDWLIAVVRNRSISKRSPQCSVWIPWLPMKNCTITLCDFALIQHHSKIHVIIILDLDSEPDKM